MDFEEKDFCENPIWNQEGRKEIRKRISETHIPVESVCADYFWKSPFIEEMDIH